MKYIKGIIKKGNYIYCALCSKKVLEQDRDICRECEEKYKK